MLAREIDRIPEGVTAECIGWADEHEPSDAAARDAAERARLAFGPDVAIAHNVMDAGIVSALRACARFVYHVHDHRPFCPNGDRLYPRSMRTCAAPLGTACVRHSLTDGCAYGPRRRTLDLIRARERLRDGIAAADAVIVCSGYVGALAIASGIDRRRVVKVPCFLPAEAYADEPQIGGNSVVFAGRVNPQKGLDTLIRGLAELPRSERPLLRVFGEGPALDACRRLAEQSDVRMNASGNVEAETLRAALDDAALLALPSRWAEPFGIVGIEAFARGRPVVAFSAGGVSEWLHDERNGIAVEAGDERALGAAIAGLVSDVDLRATIGAAARADAERYRLDPLVDRLYAAYAR